MTSRTASASQPANARRIYIDEDVYALLVANIRPFIDKTENDVLRNLLGLDREAQPAGPLPSAVATTTRRWHSEIELIDLMKAGLVKPGDVLRFRLPRRGKTVTAVVTANGQVETPDSKVHSSPSAALTYLVGHSINGWKFVHESGESLHDLRSKLAAARQHEG